MVGMRERYGINPNKVVISRAVFLSNIAKEIFYYTDLVREGSILCGKCPFCLGRATLIVAPKKKMFYCIRCHEYGNVVYFVSKVRSARLIDAANWLLTEYKF